MESTRKTNPPPQRELYMYLTFHQYRAIADSIVLLSQLALSVHMFIILSKHLLKDLYFSKLFA